MNKLLSGSLALGLLVALSGCGSDETSSDDTTRPAATSDAAGGRDDAAAPGDTSAEPTGDTAATVTSPTDTSATDATDATAVTTEPMDTAETMPDDTDAPFDTFPPFEPGEQLPGLSYIQSQVIHLVRQAFEVEGSEGIIFDEECFIDVVAQLTEEDATKIVEAGFDGDVELSEQGEALGDEAEKCITIDEESMTSTT